MNAWREHLSALTSLTSSTSNSNSAPTTHDPSSSSSASSTTTASKLLDSIASLPIPASITTAASTHGQTLLAEGTRRLTWLQKSLRSATAATVTALNGAQPYPQPHPYEDPFRHAEHQSQSQSQSQSPSSPSLDFSQPRPSQSQNQHSSSTASSTPVDADIDYVLVYHDTGYTPTPRSRAPQSTHPLPLLAPPIATNYKYPSPRAQITPYPTPWGTYNSSPNFQITANGRPLEVVSLTSYDYVHFGAAFNHSTSDGKSIGDSIDSRIGAGSGGGGNSYSGRGNDNGTTVVDIKIYSLNQRITSFRISPAKLAIKGSVPEDGTGGELWFTLRKSGYLIVKINGLREVVLLCDDAETDVPPPLGEGVFNVLEGRYKADQLGRRYSTDAFQRALMDASEYAVTHSMVLSSPSLTAAGVGGSIDQVAGLGGGSEKPKEKKETRSEIIVRTAAKTPRQAVVYVPPGLYLVQNLVLPSHVALYLEAGSVIKFSGIHHDHVPHWHKSSQGRDITRWISTTAPPSSSPPHPSSISAVETDHTPYYSHDPYPTKNITIYGRGTLDGSGHFSTTTQNPRIGNNILSPICVSGFTVKGIIIRDSGSYAVTAIRSRDVRIENVKILNRLDMPENDALCVVESRNVEVRGTLAVAAGDAFSVKTWGANGGADITRGWTGGEGKDFHVRDMGFSECVAWTGGWGFKVGEGVFGKIGRVGVDKCVVYDAAVGMGVHHLYGNASVEDVWFSECEVEKVECEFERHGHGGAGGSGTLSPVSVSSATADQRADGPFDGSWFVACTEEVGHWGKGKVTGVEVNGGVVWSRGKLGASVRGVDGGGEVGTVLFRNVVMMEDGAQGVGRRAGSWRDIGVLVAERKAVRALVEDEEVVVERAGLGTGFEDDEEVDGADSGSEFGEDW